jgi:hypothetical protein
LQFTVRAAAAYKKPRWSFVLIGEAATDIRPIQGLANVHLLGRRPYAQLPDYARGLDVGMIPFRVNDLTRAVNPIKLREYLSAGLPVVSTPLPEVERYRQLVGIARDADEFVLACSRAMARAGASKKNTRKNPQTCACARDGGEGIEGRDDIADRRGDSAGQGRGGCWSLGRSFQAGRGRGAGGEGGRFRGYRRRGLSLALTY